MTTAKSPYALGHTSPEHERLIRQARHLAPFTERFFRDAGVGPGQRVLDLGSGVGDVSLLLARLVGPAGEVVGIERDAQAIARAQARVAEAGLRNVSFTQTDVSEIKSDQPFDAVVGRFILMFLPDPVAVLRSVARLIRPGGVLAFHEVSWQPLLALSAHLPLWSSTVALVHETFRRSGGDTEMGPALYLAFQQAGLPAPKMQLEVPLGNEPDFTRWVYDVFVSLRPQMEQLHLSLDALGDLETLGERLHAEVTASGGVVPWIALVGAWSRKLAE
jgi:ubiquinone/menaquinone biosynthesis C-methylase UbiE